MKPAIASTVGKTCLLFCISLAAAGISYAQNNTSALSPPLEVLKLKWEKEVRLPRNFDPSIIPTGTTFSDPSSRVSTSSTGTAAAGAPAARTAGSNSVAFPATPGRLPVFYSYSMKMRNEGDKQIEGIAWDYLFLDPASGAELGRHQFLSYVKTLPLKTVTLRGQTRTPPVRIVHAVTNQKKPLRPIERAEIQCVLFADDTVWRNRFGRKGTCEFLKNTETNLKQKRGASQR
jgi:hypothetical protein